MKSFPKKLTFVVHLRTRWKAALPSQALVGSLSRSASFLKKKLLKKWNLSFSSGLILFLRYLQFISSIEFSFFHGVKQETTSTELQNKWMKHLFHQLEMLKFVVLRFWMSFFRWIFVCLFQSNNAKQYNHRPEENILGRSPAYFHM